MTPSAAPRRLIVNADDFGRSEAINQAVIHAHREGILTSASLMVNEPAVDEAVALARENPRLGVGLHLTLLFGHSALPPQKIPGLVNARQEFGAGPVRAGWRFFFQRDLLGQLRNEIHAQFQKFRATGLTLDHVNGHLHLHLHPTIFRILMTDAAQLGLERMRLTFDPFWLNLRLASGRIPYRLAHAAIFHLLALRARPVLKRRALRHTRAVFGLLQNARVDEAYVSRLLPRLPAGDSELYSHPSLGESSKEFEALISPRVRPLSAGAYGAPSRDEFEALISPRVRRQVEQFGIKLIRYQDL